MKEKIFTRYDAFVIAILAFLQFTVVLDFMVLSPLGAILMPELSIKPAQFGMVVSAYAFSAGASGFLLSSFMFRYLPIPLLGGGYLTIGASAPIFGLLGALVYYGRRGGSSLVRSEALAAG